MKHYGDITKLNGWELPIVDIVTGGSPCQDLSVAGKREGLDGARSGLFIEQLRVIKEMREHDRSNRGPVVDIRCIRPRYMVWENVPGAFSSNGGADFQKVLEETAKVADENAVIPRFEGGRWSTSGCIMGNGWSIAWRVHDAQFWGVPQRRKRIALVADFGGETAPEILFIRKGLSGDIEPGREEGKEVTRPIEGDIDKAISFQERAGCEGGVKEYSYKEKESVPSQHSTINPSCLNPWDVQSKHIQPECGKAESLYAGEKRYGGGESYVMAHGLDVYNQAVSEEQTMTLTGAATDSHHIPCVYGISSYDSNAMKSENPNSGIYEARTTRTLDNNGGNPACNQGGMIVLEGNGSRESHKEDGYKESETMYTLNTVEVHEVCYGLDRASFNQGQNAQYNFSVEEEKAQTIVAKGPGGVLAKQ